MEIIVGKTAGFCYGVKNAVDKSITELEKSNKVYCLGEIVHNSKVVNELESKGLVVIDSLAENKDSYKTIIRAHGVSKDVYEEAERNNIELVDLTCPNVLKIHKIVEDYRKNDFFVFVVGNKNHPETIGTVGFCEEYYTVIESEDDINDAISSFKASNLNKILIVVQTTFSLEKFNTIIEKIKKVVDAEIQVEVINTICNATRIRQEETDNISKKVQYMIIIGGKNSSNTKKLFEIAKKNCNHTVCIEDYTELNIDDVKNSETVGIMAGASTPQSSIEEVVNILKNT